MSDPKSLGGTIGAIASIEIEEFFVAPATGKEKNTLRLPLIPVACWRLDDVRFEFDSSIIAPETQEEFQDLFLLRTEFPNSPMSIFGHADPTGDEVYNKQLSGRRAMAVYAVLTRDIAKWEKIYTQAFGRDNWKTKSLQMMLTALGFDTGGVDGVAGAKTAAAMKDFQTTKTTPASGADTADNRKRLFAAYMDFLCVDPGGKPYQVQKSEFLAKDADPGGKGDVQGCSEFNPVLIFSIDDDKEFKKPARKLERDAKNGPNRRVTALLFRKGSEVPPNRWPCPTTAEGVEKCKKRFFSDAKIRSAPSEKERKFEDTKDTFACRFYQRLTERSPCEESVKFWVLRVLEAGKLPLDKRKPLADTAFVVTGEDGPPPQINGKTDKDGVLRIRVTANNTIFKLTIAGQEIILDAGALFPSGSSPAATRQRLCNLGYGPGDLKTWTPAIEAFAVKLFQAQHGLPKTGVIDGGTIAKLREAHGS